MERDSPAYVPLTTGTGANLVDQVAMPDGADIDFDPSPLAGPLSRPADLSCCARAAPADG